MNGNDARTPVSHAGAPSASVYDDGLLMELLRQEGRRRQVRGAAFERHVSACLAPLMHQGRVVAAYTFAAESREGSERVVEFALRVRDSILPIDAKWIETDGRSPSEIEAIILNRAREVRKYIRPPYTLPFALAVVDDAVWPHALAVQPRLMRPIADRVLIVAAGNLLPLLSSILWVTDLLGADMQAALTLQRYTHQLHAVTDGLRAARDIQQRALATLEALPSQV